MAMALLGLAHLPAHSQIQATPWSYFVPTDINAKPSGGVAVRFPSAPDKAPAVQIDAVLYKPAGVAKGAVVIVNSTGGWSDAREGNYGRSLSSAGYAVLAIDSYGPRGVTGTQTDITRLDVWTQVRDAFAARRYLVGAGFDAEHVAVLGTGRGGTIAVLAADRTFLPDESERFALSMAISANCIFHPRQPKPSANLFLAVADKDDIAGVQPCRDLAVEYSGAGGRVTLKNYPGASNSFDGHPAMVRPIREPFAETFGECRVPVEPDGRSTFAGKTFGEADFSALVIEMRKSCIKPGGTVWTNLTRKANVTLDVIEFLDASFRR